MAGQFFCCHSTCERNPRKQRKKRPSVRTPTSKLRRHNGRWRWRVGPWFFPKCMAVFFFYAISWHEAKDSWSQQDELNCGIVAVERNQISSKSSDSSSMTFPSFHVVSKCPLQQWKCSSPSSYFGLRSSSRRNEGIRFSFVSVCEFNSTLQFPSRKH